MVLFNSDGERFASSCLVPQAGHFAAVSDRADKCVVNAPEVIKELRDRVKA